MEEQGDTRTSELRQRVVALKAQVERAKDVLHQWTDASAQLSRNAAEARAKNQLRGRGIGGLLLGASFRAAARRDAARSNARIANEVAEKRSTIAAGKREAQELLRSLRTQLAAARKALAAQTITERSQQKRSTAEGRAAADSLSLLNKLKEAHRLGLVTDAEYEQKRKELASKI